MVEKIDTQYKSWPIPRVRIETRELVEIIEKCVGPDMEIVAECGDFRFNGLRDIEDNREFLAGNPTFKFDDITITLTPGPTRGITHYGLSQSNGRNRAEVIAESVRKQLAPHTTWVRREWFSFVVSFLFVQLLFFIFTKDDWRWEKLFLWAFLFGLLVVPLTMILERSISTDQVFFSKKSSFIGRNTDNFIVSLLVTVLGGLIVLFLTGQTP